MSNKSYCKVAPLTADNISLSHPVCMYKSPFPHVGFCAYRRQYGPPVKRKQIQTKCVLVNEMNEEMNE